MPQAVLTFIFRVPIQPIYHSKRMKPLIKIPQPHILNQLEGQRELRLTMRDKLIDCLGFFCSYCEIPLGGYEVEHHKPFKEWKPFVLADDWQGLLLICKDCREHIRKPVLTSTDMASMLWPDEDLTFSLDEYSPFIYKPRNVIYRVVNEEDKFIEEKQLELIFIETNENSSPEIQAKAANTIVQFQLNMSLRYYSYSKKSGITTITVPDFAHFQMLDNRIFERTRAWKEAHEAADRYIIMRDNLEELNRPDILEAFKKQVSAHAYFKGNWSVWMTVFWQKFNDIQLLKELFINNDDYFGNINLG